MLAIGNIRPNAGHVIAVTVNPLLVDDAQLSKQAVVDQSVLDISGNVDRVPHSFILVPEEQNGLVDAMDCANDVFFKNAGKVRVVSIDRRLLLSSFILYLVVNG